jgi:hypothetical protein
MESTWTWASGLTWKDLCCECKVRLNTVNGNCVKFNDKLWCVPCLLDAGTKSIGPVIDIKSVHESIWGGLGGGIP